MLLEFEHTHVTIMHDNEALYDISWQNLMWQTNGSSTNTAGSGFFRIAFVLVVVFVLQVRWYWAGLYSDRQSEWFWCFFRPNFKENKNAFFWSFFLLLRKS